MFIGMGLVVFGLIAGVFWFVSHVSEVSDAIDRFSRSDSDLPLEFTINETVDWALFIEPSSASLSGVRFAIVNTQTLETVPLKGIGGFTYNWFGRSGRSVAGVELQPGHYRLQVEGDGTIAIGESPSGLIWRAIGGAVLVGFLPALIGIVIAVVSAIRDTRRRTANAEPPPPSPWSAGEWPAEPGG